MKITAEPLKIILNEMDSIGTKDTAVLQSEDGWDFHTMDPSYSCMVIAKLKPVAFPDGYEAGDQICFPVGFALDAIGKNDSIDLTAENGVMTIKGTKSKRTHGLVAYDAPRPVPKLEKTNTCVISSSELQGVLGQSSLRSIRTDKGGVLITLVENGLTVQIDSEVESAEYLAEGICDIPGGEQFSRFNIDLIVPLIKGLPKNATVTLSMDTATPLWISVDEELYSMDIYIAPIINLEEQDA